MHFSVYISYDNRKFKNFINWNTNETVNINPKKQNVLTDFGRTEDKENTRNNANGQVHFMSPKEHSNDGDRLLGLENWKWILVVATDILPQGDISQK